ncbi:hypothetical protein FAM18175_02827 [Lacticaseibacillus paracasei]|nr:hypothetical protein FAM18175_02827 [Lacticaseibacillus paracasei]
MEIVVKVIVITYATLTGIVSLMSFKNTLTKKYSILGSLRSLGLITSVWLLETNGLFGLLAFVVALTLIQVKTHLNGKSLYSQVHLAHHIIRLFIHIVILALI